MEPKTVLPREDGAHEHVGVSSRLGSRGRTVIMHPGLFLEP